jgi:uncharacterized protein (UPF0264 family)
MQLLVSAANGDDALAALAGGADIIDTKDPAAGALGAVSLEVFRQIHSLVAGARPVSAALSDAIDELAIERIAREYSEAGATFVKVGFAGIADAGRVRSLIAAAVAGVRRAGPFGPAARVVAVTYADQPFIARSAVVQLAAHSGAGGVLIDTADKHGPGLRRLVSTDDLRSWIDSAHDAGLVVAAAGKLTIDDLDWVCDCGADIAGVRGAACENGRTSRVVAEKVRRLRKRIALDLEPVFEF